MFLELFFPLGIFILRGEIDTAKVADIKYIFNYY